MTGAGVNVPNLQKITEKKPLVQVTTFASKAGKKDPIVNCSVFQDYVANAQPRIPVRCDAS